MFYKLVFYSKRDLFMLYFEVIDILYSLKKAAAFPSMSNMLGDELLL